MIDRNLSLRVFVDRICQPGETGLLEFTRRFVASLPPGENWHPHQLRKALGDKMLDPRTVALSVTDGVQRFIAGHAVADGRTHFKEAARAFVEWLPTHEKPSVDEAGQMLIRALPIEGTNEGIMLIGIVI